MTVEQLLQSSYIVRPDALNKARSAQGMQIEEFRKTTYKVFRTQNYRALIKSQDDPKAYYATLEFSKFADPVKDIPDYDVHPVKCRCGCLEFYFTWSYYNKVNNVLFGGPVRKYVRKTTTYPERNPRHLPGFCKHLMRILVAMKKNRVARGGSL